MRSLALRMDGGKAFVLMCDSVRAEGEIAGVTTDALVLKGAFDRLFILPFANMLRLELV